MPNTIKPRQNQVVAKITTSPVRQAALTPSFDLLPDSAFIREAQLVQSHKRPNYPTVLPFSAATLWRKIKAGTFCKPYKLSDRVTAFKVGEVRAWISSQTQTLAQGVSNDL